MTPEKSCIVSVGNGGWYKKGIDRLEKSLNYVGYSGNTLFYRDELPIDSPNHIENPYAFKLYAIDEAINKGYTHILWLDASFWAVRNPAEMFDYINERGWHLFRTGYNLAQSCNDRILEYAGINRDKAETITEWATGCIGLNFENQQTVDLYNRWKQYMNDGMFRGSRLHDNQSSDQRFLFHRQDQSGFSCAVFEKGITMPNNPEFVAYYGTPHNTERIIFFIRGL